MPAQPLDELRAADDDARLRPAEQLVAGEADEIGARGEARGCGRLVADVEQRPRAEIVDERQPGLVGDARELVGRDGRGEPDDSVVRLVDAEDRGRLGPDRALVVRGTRPVRRPDLDHARARAREHVGNPEAVADLDELAARDEHLATLRERCEREQHRRGVVVDDERRLRAR